MKAKLIKTDSNYYLYVDGKIIASTEYVEGKQKLSKQNCDKIFGVVDVEKLAEQFTVDESYGEISGDLFKGYIYGFNKAIELNKDKLFTVEDVKRFVRWGIHQAYLEDIYDTTHLEKATVEICNQLIESIQQPTEIEVTFNPEEKDSEGCLILKRVV